MERRYVENIMENSNPINHWFEHFLIKSEGGRVTLQQMWDSYLTTLTPQEVLRAQRNKFYQAVTTRLLDANMAIIRPNGTRAVKDVALVSNFNLEM